VKYLVTFQTRRYNTLQNINASFQLLNTNISAVDVAKIVWGVVRVYCWECRWKNFEDRSIFDEVIKLGSLTFTGPACILPAYFQTNYEMFHLSLQQGKASSSRLIVAPLPPLPRLCWIWTIVVPYVLNV